MMNRSAAAAFAAAWMVVALMFLPSVAAGASLTSFTSSQPSFAPPEQIQISAVTDEQGSSAPSGDIALYETTGGTRTLLQTCTDAAVCSRTISAAWNWNDNPVDRTYRAESGASSMDLTVGVSRTDFNPILVASVHDAQPGDTVALTATTAVPVTSSGYRMRIVELSSTGEIARSTCTSGSSCTATATIPWADNAAPQPKQYKVRVERAVASDGYIWHGNTEVVNVTQVLFDVELQPTEIAPAANGDKRFSLTATSDRDMQPPAYRLVIRRQDGTTTASCSYGTSCALGYAPPGRYRASVIKHTTGQVFGQSFWVDITTEGALVLGDGYVDFVEAEDLWDSVEEFCLDVAAFGTHTQSSVSQEWLAACSSGAFGTVGQAMAALLVAPPDGRGTLVRVIVAVGAGVVVAGVVTSPSSPPVTPTPTPTPSPTPTPTPTPFGPGPVDAPVNPNSQTPGVNFTQLEYDFMERNADALNSQLGSGQAPAATKILMRECHRRLARIFQDIGDCTSKPIFAPGSDVTEAAEWDINAQWVHPEWVELRYLNKGANTDWYLQHSETEYFVANPADRCEGSGVLGTPGATACHEYPYWQSREGGEPVGLQPTPFLKIISAADNSQEGNKLRSFARPDSAKSCRLVADANANNGIGVPFLVLPNHLIPTVHACNGYVPSA